MPGGRLIEVTEEEVVMVGPVGSGAPSSLSGARSPSQLWIRLIPEAIDSRRRELWTRSRMEDGFRGKELPFAGEDGSFLRPA